VGLTIKTINEELAKRVSLPKPGSLKWRNAVDDTSGALPQCRYVLQGRDIKFCSAFEHVLASESLLCLTTPPRSPRSCSHFFLQSFLQSSAGPLGSLYDVAGTGTILAAQGFKGSSAKIELRLTFRLVHEATTCPAGSEVG
jgi:hypothetical protein